MRVRIGLLLAWCCTVPLLHAEGGVSLLDAVNNGAVSVVEQLIADGANLNIADKNGNTALIIASQKGNLPIVKKLVVAKADINARNKDKENALDFACWYKKPEVAKFLIESGIEASVRSRNGSPLVYAASQGLHEITRMILDCPGIDVNVRDKFNRNALLLVVRWWGCSEEERQQIIRKLVKLGVEMNVEDNEYFMTPLIQAVWSRKEEVADLLLELGADINYTNPHGETAYIKALQIGNIQFAEHLKQKGAKELKPFFTASYLPDKNLTPTQKWLLATTVIYCQIRREEHESLNLDGYKINSKKRYENILREWSDIKSKEELLTSLEQNKKSGWRFRFDDAAELLAKKKLLYEEPSMKDDADFVLRKYKKNRKVAFLAWDYCRYIWLVRAGYSAGYLTEQEAWELMLPIGIELQKNFTSWKDMGESYLAGRKLWHLLPSENKDDKDGKEDKKEEEKENQEFDGVFRILTYEYDKESPWNKNRWDTKLELPMIK